MKIRFLIVLILLGLNSKNYCQKKYFSGAINYEISIQSKIVNYTENDFLLSLADSKLSTAYFNTTKMKLFNEYKNEFYDIETLTGFVRFFGNDSLFEIKEDSITILSKLSEEQFPYYDKIKNRTIELVILDTNYLGYKCFKETQLYYNDTIISIYLDTNSYHFATSLLLYKKYSNKYYTQIKRALSIYQSQVNDSITKLPNLPIGKDFNNAYSTNAYYNDKENKSWRKYLSENINASLGGKYIKIPKGEMSAKETVIVEFIIDKEGKITNAFALNKEFVHKKLAENALKVITNCKNWIPQMYKDKGVVSIKRQPITFQVNIE